jgi:hypothetical protein
VFEHASLSQEPAAPFAGYVYDVSPDGTRFLVGIPSAEAAPPTPIVVLLDWALPTGR